MFKKLKARFGGGTTVDTVVHTPATQPGGTVDGVVEIVGGEFEQKINFMAHRLEVRVEVERDDGESHRTDSFAEQHASGPFTLRPGERHSLPFLFDVPWQTPFTHLGGHELPGIRLGMRTELDIAGSLDKGDLDPLRIDPHPAQLLLLDAFARAGCVLRRSDVESGRIPGAEFSFYQEVEFSPPPQHSGRLKEVEVTFLSGPQGMDVLVEGDRRSGFRTAGGDRVHRLSVPYDALDRHDWTAVVHEHLEELVRRRGLFG